jgi:hypothetical protein
MFLRNDISYTTQFQVIVGGHLVITGCRLRGLFFLLRIEAEYVRFEDFTAVTMRNAVFWDV